MSNEKRFPISVPRIAYELLEVANIPDVIKIKFGLYEDRTDDQYGYVEYDDSLACAFVMAVVCVSEVIAVRERGQIRVDIANRKLNQFETQLRA